MLVFIQHECGIVIQDFADFHSGHPENKKPDSSASAKSSGFACLRSNNP
ncbi:hypothetical protein JOS77_30330 [Chromobacterium haemolyticum]|nr:hypothetical protein JOS77_30330 [Chromobacterium haemolyticum]